MQSESVLKPMEISEILSKLESLNLDVPTDLIVVVWLLVQVYRQVSKVNLTQTFEMEEAIVKKCAGRCQEVAEIFGAQRCLYWQVSNGQKFMNRWPKKMLVALAEYMDPNANLIPFKQAFAEVTTMRFDRNIKALINSEVMVKSGGSSLTVNYGKEGANIEVFRGAIFIEDEGAFTDEVSKINLQYGWRSIAACLCKDRRGNLIGFLVLGFTEPHKSENINMELFKDQGRTFYKNITSVTARYSLKSRLVRAVLNSRVFS